MCNCRIFSASSYFAQITPTDFTAWGFVHNGVKKKKKKNQILPPGREGAESDGGCLAQRTPGASANMRAVKTCHGTLRAGEVGWKRLNTSSAKQPGWGPLRCALPPQNLPVLIVLIRQWCWILQQLTHQAAPDPKRSLLKMLCQIFSVGFSHHRTEPAPQHVWS